MARCDEGYLCEVCGGEVAVVTDSDLYLRFTLGEVPLERLHQEAERHLRCNPALAQYIVDSAFPGVVCGGAFGKAGLAADYVRAEEGRVTQGWRRLQLIPTLGLSLAEYPLTVTPLTAQEETP